MFLWTGHFSQRPGAAWKKPVINLTKLSPLPTDRFRVVPALDKNAKEAISFQYVKKWNWYLTVKRDQCLIEPKKRTIQFERGSSFFPMINCWFDGYTAFESSIKTGWYLCLVQSTILLQKYDGTKEFKQQASFKLTKKSVESNSFKSSDSVVGQQSSCSCLFCESQSEFCLYESAQNFLTSPGQNHLECFVKNDYGLQHNSV